MLQKLQGTLGFSVASRTPEFIRLKFADVKTFRVLPQMILPMTLEKVTAFYEKLRKRILQHLKP